MKIIAVPYENVVVNPDIATRKGGHDQDNIEKIAKSYMQRAEEGMDPIQINPGLVRPLDGKSDMYELIDGGGRLAAVGVVNEAGGIDGQPMLFQCQVARANDLAAIISGIQANFHASTDIFDRADAMAKLEALGKKQKDIAATFGMSEPTVSQMLKLNKCPKKYQQAFRDGDLEQDAVIAIADLDTTDAQRQEIFEEAVRHKERINTILARKEFKDKKAALDAEIAAAKERAEALAAQAKEAEKAAKEAEKLLVAAKDLKAKEKAQKEKDAADVAKKKVGKEQVKAQKEVIKLKDAKAKLAESAPGPKKSKATAEDIKAAAKEKGVKNVGPTPMGKAQFIAELEAMEGLSKAAISLIGRIQGTLAGDYTVAQLRNSFIANCVKD